MKFSSTMSCVFVIGAVSIAPGALGGERPLLKVSVPGVKSSGFGTAVAAGHDLTGDGIDDVLVGAPEIATGSPGGMARVVSGKTGAVATTKFGTQGQRFGASVAILGDVNGDGRADYAVGAPWPAGVGTVFVYSGATGSLLYSIAGAHVGGQFGASLAALGDVNSDGRPDFAVGEPMGSSASSPGAVQVRSGTNGSLLFQVNGWNAGEKFGRSLACAGDVNHDGRPDIVAGASNPGVTWGVARVLSGANGSPLLTLSPGSSSPSYGLSVAGVGDVNHDGTPDVAVGDPVGSGSGVVRVYSGQDGAVLHTWNGAILAGRFGFAVSGAGDVDQDGYFDVLVGAPGQAFWPGSAVLVSGKSGNVLFELVGSSAGDELGAALCAAGDTTGGGALSLAVGAPWADVGISDTGAVSWVAFPQDKPKRDGLGKDTDGDGIADHADEDIDGDGVANKWDDDIDGDGKLNGDDDDVDGDGKKNIDDDDIDGDGKKNTDDPDMDGDGKLNGDDPDMDGDGTLNGDDVDLDGDGTKNKNDSDTDGDKIKNEDDSDKDGDGVGDDTDQTPLGADGALTGGMDKDQDGVPDFADDDLDGDGKKDKTDDDVDGDGLKNDVDDDVDGDGILNQDDDDVDGDGAKNKHDNDIDGDGKLNENDDDDDNDGFTDGQDFDADGDGFKGP